MFVIAEGPVKGIIGKVFYTDDTPDIVYVYQRTVFITLLIKKAEWINFFRNIISGDKSPYFKGKNIDFYPYFEDIHN